MRKERGRRCAPFEFDLSPAESTPRQSGHELTLALAPDKEGWRALFQAFTGKPADEKKITGTKGLAGAGSLTTKESRAKGSVKLGHYKAYVTAGAPTL
eukprot:scaffold260_cov328-Prasinococcus_capsulatus_cf.AAC.15